MASEMDYEMASSSGVSDKTEVPTKRVPIQHQLTQADEKKLEQQLVLITWLERPDIQRPLFEREVAMNLTSPNRTHVKMQLPIECYAVGMIYMIRNQATNAPNAQRTTFIVTSGEANIKWKGPNTECWVIDPRTGQKVQVSKLDRIEVDSGLLILQTREWNTEYLPHRPDALVHMSAQRAQGEREVRYMGFALGGRETFKSTGELGFGKDVFTMNTGMNSRPSICRGAPIMTTRGEVCAIVVNDNPKGLLAIFQLTSGRLYKDLEYLHDKGEPRAGEQAPAKPFGSVPADQLPRYIEDQWRAEDEPEVPLWPNFDPRVM